MCNGRSDLQSSVCGELPGHRVPLVTFLREEGLSGQTRATIYGAMRDMQARLKKGFKEVTDMWKRDRNGGRSEYLSEAGLGRP